MVLNWILPAAQALADVTKRHLASVIKANTPPPKPIIATLVKSDVFTLVREAFVKSESWTESPKIQAKVDLGDYTYADLSSQAHKIAHYSLRCQQGYDVDTHLRAVNQVIFALNELQNETDSSNAMKNFTTKFCSAMHSFASEIEDFWNNQEFNDLQEVEAWDKQRFKFGSDASYDYYLANNAFIQTNDPAFPTAKDHHDSLNILINILQDDNVDESAVIMVLSPSLSTSGLAIIGDVEFPHFQPLFNENWIKQHRDTIWYRRYQSKLFFEDDEPPQPASFDVSDIIYLEKKVSTRLDDMDFTKLHSDFFKRSSGKMTSAPPSRAEPEKAQTEAPEATSSNQVPPPQKNQTQQPAVPDDTTYNPDPVLSMKIRQDIKAVQALPATDTSYDHMTRFNATDEHPRSLSKWEVKPGDLRLLKGNSTLDGFYVITFTRKSRKPIFNSVTTD